MEQDRVWSEERGPRGPRLNCKRGTGRSPPGPRESPRQVPPGAGPPGVGPGDTSLASRLQFSRGQERERGPTRPWRPRPRQGVPPPSRTSATSPVQEAHGVQAADPPPPNLLHHALGFGDAWSGPRNTERRETKTNNRPLASRWPRRREQSDDVNRTGPLCFLFWGGPPAQPPPSRPWFWLDEEHSAEREPTNNRPSWYGLVVAAVPPPGPGLRAAGRRQDRSHSMPTAWRPRRPAASTATRNAAGRGRSRTRSHKGHHCQMRYRSGRGDRGGGDGGGEHDEGLSTRGAGPLSHPWIPR